MSNTDIIFYLFNHTKRDTNIAFSQSSLEENKADGYIEVSKETFDKLYEAINKGCIIDKDLNISEPPPGPFYTFNGKNWILDKVTLKENIKEQRSNIWEAIKAKRSEKIQAGVYLPKTDKWFHTDGESRIRYLALMTLPLVPEGLRWKTMDNTWIPITKKILLELMSAVMIHEQRNFEVAELHKVAMEKLDDPSSYDFSTGWLETYEEWEAKQKVTS